MDNEKELTDENKKVGEQVESSSEVQSEVAEQHENKLEESPSDSTEQETASPKAESTDQGDDEEEDHHEEAADEGHDDYAHMSKEDLVTAIKELAKHEPPMARLDRILKEIRPAFDEFKEKERAEALERFLADGGSEEDFDYKSDELTTVFDATFKLLKDKRNAYYKEKEKQKDDNLKKKEGVLDKLRALLDSEETNHSFQAFKAIQEEWKAIGPVPGLQARTLWANYSALVDRFYDNRSIYFELKELDRKKNLELKLELCEKVEALNAEASLRDAIRELNDLHNEFKHIGPVPQEEQEPLWQRFKAASDSIYAKRKEYNEVLKKDLEENLEKKLALGATLQEYAQFTSDSIKEWNAKTKEIIDIQKQWEAIGGLPRERAKEVNKLFWASFKSFFHNKGAFFKKLDALREENLKKKQELVQQAEELKVSHEWEATAQAFKNLQAQWKEIGPVPERVKNDIYKSFKEACDYFFDHRRNRNHENQENFKENLLKKEAICDKLEGMISQAAEPNEELIDTFRELEAEFHSIGFVPKENVTSIKTRFSQAVDKFIEALPFGPEDKQQLRMENQVQKLKNDPNADKKMFRKEQAIRKQIQKVENDIALLKNNMEFFADSKTAEKLKGEFNGKIKMAQNQLKNLKMQLRVIRTS
jgi:hypothetical protein